MKNETATAPAEKIDVRPSTESLAKYLVANVPGIESLPFVEILAWQAKLYSEWQGSDERKAERAERRAAREEAAETARADREAKKLAKLEADREKIVEAAKRLGIVPSDVVS